MKKVLELPAFRRLLVAAVLNELAFSIGSVALALLVYRRTGSAIAAMAFFLCVDFGPAVLSPFLVARLDQRSTARVLGSLYVLEAAVFLLAAWFVGRYTLLPILGLGLIDASLAVTARVLGRAAWTSLTSPAGLLREANAAVNTALAAAFMVGPGVGGIIVGIGGTATALLVNVGLFVVGVLAVATARGLPHAVSDPVPSAGRIRAAVSRAREEPMIRRLLALQTIGMLVFALSIPVEVVLVRHTLHGGAASYGILLSAWGAGGIVGSTVYARWRGMSPRYLITAGTIVLGIGFVVMAAAPIVAVAVAGSAVAGVGNGIQIVAFRTALQEATPQRWMALILSLNESMFQAVPGAGILLGGAITAVAGSRAALGTASAGSLMLAAVMWTKLRGVGSEDATVRASSAEVSEHALTTAAPRA